MNGYGGRSKNSRPYYSEYGRGFGPEIESDQNFSRYDYGHPDYGRVYHEPPRGPHRLEMSESFRGRGPKGYHRTDDRIREDVCDFLTDHPEIDASDIEVEVKEGEVLLSGLAVNRRMKWLAEELAEMVPGVRDVQNDIRIKGKSEGKFGSKSRDKGDKGDKAA